MKRILAALLLISLLLCGCGKIPAEDTPAPSPVQQPESSDNTPEPEVTAPSYPQQPMQAVAMPAEPEMPALEEDLQVFTRINQGITMTFNEPEIVDKIMSDIQDRIWEFDREAEQIRKQAIQDAPLEIPYSYQNLYSPMRIDCNVLSLYGTVISYSGGNHGSVYNTAANYNMLTGEVLTLGSILKNMDALEPLCQLLISQLQEQREDLQLIDGYEDIVRDALLSDESYNENWFFTQTGLNFFFAPYEIAPYVVGTVTVEIPYSKLSGLIGDGFFPPEREAVSGSIQAVRFQDADLDGFTQSIFLCLDQVGEEFFLYTDTTVYDVRLEVGTWNAAATVFTPTYNALAVYSLTPGDGIIVKAAFGDVLPTLRLSYVSGEERICKYIMQSGKDGSILLIDP